jgi:hypothetical protein
MPDLAVVMEGVLKEGLNVAEVEAETDQSGRS